MFLLELEAAQYEAERAYRQYNKIDPENRLVASQLESKWNECLQKVESIKAKLAQINEVVQPLTDEERTEIMVLSQDLPKLWNAATTTNEMKKKIIRTVIEEIVVDVDHERSLVLTVIHWVGGVHSQIEIKKNRTGEHKKATVKSTIELVRQLARQMSDPDIAALLNKLKLKSGIGATWTMDRVRALRYRNDIPVYQKGEQQEIITLEQAAEELGVSPQSVRTLIQRNVISASQIISGAPWAISIRELEKEKVKNAVQRIKNGSNRYNDLRPSEKQIAFIQ